MLQSKLLTKNNVMEMMMVVLFLFYQVDLGLVVLETVGWKETIYALT